MKRILVVTPKFPYPDTGACEKDRARGIEDLIRYGYEVRVITKIDKHQTPEQVELVAGSLGIKIYPVYYKYTGRLSLGEKIVKLLKKFAYPLYLDGAAFEYSEAEIKNLFEEQLKSWSPDLVWFDYTYLWPLYKMAQKSNIPIITRSINFEPKHFLEEDGYTFINYLKYPSKWISEYITTKNSDILFSITPNEEKIYRKMSAGTYVANLPLRGLPKVLNASIQVKQRDVLHVFFMGSTYNVVHNRKALEFIIKDIAPATEKKFPGTFVFHVLGSKVPKDLERYFNNKNIIYDGPKYKEDLEVFLSGMDIALIPSLCGAGMQQKIFEPISRGIPTLTSARGIAGYNFVHGRDILCANTTEEYVMALGSLRDQTTRQKLSNNSVKLANEQFSQNEIDEKVRGAIERLTT